MRNYSCSCVLKSRIFPAILHMSSFTVVISGVVGLGIPVIPICWWMITGFTYNSCLILMSVRSIFISRLQPYPMAEPEGAFQGLLQLGAGYITAGTWNPLNTTQKWPWPPWRPWVLSHPGGKTAAKAAMLRVQVRGTCRQQGRSSRLSSRHRFGQTT